MLKLCRCILLQLSSNHAVCNNTSFHLQPNFLLKPLENPTVVSKPEIELQLIMSLQEAMQLGRLERRGSVERYNRWVTNSQGKGGRLTE